MLGLELMATADLFEDDFHTIAGLVALYGEERPNHPALIHEDRTLTYAELNGLMDRVGVALSRDGVTAQPKVNE